MNRLIVATECPSCGASLDFSEGTNAVRCGHCGSNLFVTGRKQVLSYAVSPKVDERRSVAVATMTQRNLGRDNFRRVVAILYYIPYYRMTGQDFCWEEPPPKPAEEEGQEVFGEGAGESGIDLKGWLNDDSAAFGNTPSFLKAAEDLLVFAMDMAIGKHPEEKMEGNINPSAKDISRSGSQREESASSEKGKEVEHQAAFPRRGSLYEKKEVLLNDRYIEKNFIACDLRGMGFYSLGVRPAVLRLQLFRRESLTPGVIVGPSLDPATAEDIGLMPAQDHSVLRRQVIGKVLSLIYFPFWMVEMESEGKALLTVIDAVSGMVIRGEAPVSLKETLGKRLIADPKTIGFRPFTCPNCGWDLAARPDDTIFPCPACARAWQIQVNDLVEVSYKVAEVLSIAPSGEKKYLPFWVLDAEDRGGAMHRLVIPAFRYRRLKFLLEVALRMTRMKPAYDLVVPERPELSGCYYDCEDAEVLAEFIFPALSSGKVAEFSADQGKELTIKERTLIWFPFRVEGAYLVSPFGGVNIPKNLLW